MKARGGMDGEHLNARVLTDTLDFVNSRSRLPRKIGLIEITVQFNTTESSIGKQRNVTCRLKAVGPDNAGAYPRG